MRLKDLDARFVWQFKAEPQTFRDDCPSIGQAQGIIFICPKCFTEKGSNIGVHSVICWFKGRGIPDHAEPKPGRWNPSGTGIDDLTFVPPGAVSVHLTGKGCGWHGFVRNGDAT